MSGAKLDALLGLCETVDCRRMRLLDYFGEASGACGNCDNCLTPPEEWDAHRSRTQAHVMHLPLRTGERLRIRRDADHRCVDRATYGEGGAVRPRSGEHLRDRQGTFRAAMARRHSPARRAATSASGLRPVQRPATDAGCSRGVEWPQNSQAAKAIGEASAATQARSGERYPPLPARDALAGESGDVFQALREWRKGVAKEHGVPAYTVFHDATLQEIARLLPDSLDGLRGISGIGATKLERYGEPLLKVVRERAAGAGLR